MSCTSWREVMAEAEHLTRDAFAAVGHRLPYGVIQAEHEAAIAEAKVIGEITRRPDPACLHEDGAIARSVGSTFEGSCTHYLFCAKCDGWFVVVEDAITQTVESRPMTAAEQLRFAAAEDRVRRSEWLGDYQEGAS